MQINLKKVYDICEANIGADYACPTNCPAMDVCRIFSRCPCEWDIAEMEKKAKQFNRGQNKKTYY